MEQLVIRGEELNKIREIVNVMGGYTVVKQIVEDERTPMVFEPKEGTCSSCPYFSRLEGPRTEYLKYGECTHKMFAGAKANMYMRICPVREAELGIKVIRED